MMKGALLVLALLMTRELTFKTIEGSMEGPDGPPDPCPMPSHCILHSPVLATSRGRSAGGWQISVQESFTKSLGLSVFNGESGEYFVGGIGAHWEGGRRLICPGMVVKARGVSRPRPACCYLC